MIVLKKVLVATDFSPASEAALTYGRALALTFGASLDVLHVTENFFLRPTPADPHAILAAKTRAITERLAGAGPAVNAHAAVTVSDDAADAIVEYAHRNSIDVIVLGTHGRSGVEHLLVGSVAERVVRKAPCPVLTVRHPEREFVVHDHQTSEAAMIILKKILVATDFSEPSDAALAYAQELARAFGAQLLIAHVVDNVVARAYGPDAFVLASPELQSALETSALRQVESLISAEDRDLLRAEPVILISNAPSAALVDYAGASDVDLMVLGTHGRGGVAHLLLGSVAERVVRSAPCPVLTVRHPEHEFVVPDALVAVTKA